MSRESANDKWLKKKKARAQYWQVKRFLESLRLKFIEKDKELPTYNISVPLFGLKFRFKEMESYADSGWKVFVLDEDMLEIEPSYFRDDVMWYLISKSYMSYIRDLEVGGHGRIFKRFIIEAGWGTKIIKKRIELCGNNPENTYLKLRMQEFLKVPLPKILAYYPCFFDYLI